MSAIALILINTKIYNQYIGYVTENNVRDLERELAAIVPKYSEAQHLAKETQNQ